MPRATTIAWTVCPVCGALTVTAQPCGCRQLQGDSAPVRPSHFLLFVLSFVLGCAAWVLWWVGL